MDMDLFTDIPVYNISLSQSYQIFLRQHFTWGYRECWNIEDYVHLQLASSAIGALLHRSRVSMINERLILYKSWPRCGEPRLPVQAGTRLEFCTVLLPRVSVSVTEIRDIFYFCSATWLALIIYESIVNDAWCDENSVNGKVNHREKLKLSSSANQVQM